MMAGTRLPRGMVRDGATLCLHLRLPEELRMREAQIEQRIVGEAGQLALELRGVPPVVLVDERDELAGRTGHTEVPSRGRALVRLVDVVHLIPPRRDDRGGVVGGPVVDHDDLVG